MKLVLVAVLIIFMNSCSSSQGRITIVGETKNINTKKVYLTDAYEWEIFLDSATVRDDKFKFELQNDKLKNTIYSITYIDSIGRPTKISFKNHILSSDSMKYTIDAFVFDEDNIVITGDQKVSEYYSIKAGKETDAFFSTQMIQFGDLSRDIEKRTRQLDTYISLIKKYPYSQYLLSKINENKALINKSELNLMLKNFNQNSLQIGAGKKLQDYLSVKVDNPFFQNIILEDTESSPSKIYEPSAKINMLVVWASWCGPCRQEIPEIKKLYDLYSKKGLVITSISIDDTKEAWKKALKVENMNWRQLIVPAQGKERFNKEFEVGSIPYVIFVDAKGKLLSRFIGYEKNQIEEYKKVIAGKL